MGKGRDSLQRECRRVGSKNPGPPSLWSSPLTSSSSQTSSSELSYGISALSELYSSELIIHQIYARTVYAELKQNRLKMAAKWKMLHDAFALRNCNKLGFSWSWGRPQPWSKLYNLSALFLASEAARMWHLHIWQGIVRLTYTGQRQQVRFPGCCFFLPCRTLPTDHLQCLARRLARPFQALSKHVGTSLCCGTRLAEI